MGLGRRSVLAQVLSRGVAWFVLTPMLVGVAASLVSGRLPDGYTAFFAATSAGALLLARPALHTEAARKEFSPVAYRRVFLAGAVASAMVATAVAISAAALMPEGVGLGVGLAALAAALFASVIGVVRMRAWGVLLGGVTSVVALVAALFSGQELVSIGLALAALPGLLLASPLVAARLGVAAPRGIAVDPSGSDRGHRHAVAGEREDATPLCLRAHRGGRRGRGRGASPIP